jgi:hypothetical protein
LRRRQWHLPHELTSGCRVERPLVEIVGLERLAVLKGGFVAGPGAVLDHPAAVAGALESVAGCHLDTPVLARVFSCNENFFNGAGVAAANASFSQQVLEAIQNHLRALRNEHCSYRWKYPLHDSYGATGWIGLRGLRKLGAWGPLRRPPRRSIIRLE